MMFDDTLQKARKAVALSQIIHRQPGGALPLTGFPGAGAKQAAFQGPIHSSVPGRTDRHLLGVKSGSYVIPADIVSIAGQGNTAAGNVSFDLAFPKPMAPGRAGPGQHMPPLQMRPLMKHAMKPGQQFTPHAHGGDTPSPHPGIVPIVAAGGEINLSPEQIIDKFGDLDHGHKILDAMVLKMRKKEIERLKTTPPPKKWVGGPVYAWGGRV